MKALKFFLVFSGILAASAFLAPWIYQLTGFKFERILSRLVMIFSLFAILCLMRWDFKGLLRYGLTWDPERSASFLTRGFVIGVVTLGLLTAAAVFLGGREWLPRWKGIGVVISKTLQYGFAAFLIGVLEETFFRGFLYGRLKERWNLFWSLAGTNSFYSLLHFFKGGNYGVPPNPDFTDSFKSMFHLLDPFWNPAQLVPAFLGLLLFGLILSYCYLKTRSLYFSIGLHAGCVFFLKVDGWFVGSVPNTSLLIFGSKNLYDGLLGLFFFGILFLFLTRLLRNNTVKQLK
ncbi:MAG TPA: CPBP family intramembrane metalloprotease [Candidatus Omnitrophota bacterium]|nr:CPBP family intramembrane metalloprotease [Candidatus Omnitrophota bacterium]